MRTRSAAPVPETSAVVMAPRQDTTPVDLSRVREALPPAVSDARGGPRAPSTVPLAAPPVDYPGAPAALRSAVTRETAVSQFCFQEFGEKADPTLEGAVAVLVTISHGAIEDARVASARWSDGRQGAHVDQCLNDRVVQAWRLAPEDSAIVAGGHYVVYLSFRGS